MFRPGDYVFIDKPTSSETNGETAKTAVTYPYNKELPRIFGPFCVVAMKTHSLVIGEQDPDNTFLFDKALHALFTVRAPYSDERQQPTKFSHEGITDTFEYAVKKIVRHICTGDKIKNVLRLYGYSAKSGTEELARHNP